MDRMYFKIVQGSLEIAQDANYLVANAAYRKDVDEDTEPHLIEYYNAVERCREVLSQAVSRQMSLKPLESDSSRSHLKS